MSSVPEERNAIVQKYIPRLITNMTGFSPSEENYKLCMQFVWSHVKHHRYLSVNLHEVKRDIEGICEKFKLNNFHDEEREFRRICERTLAHELSVNHYEKDVMYSIINLLTTLAYDPIGRLKDRKRKGLPVFMRIKKFEEKFSQENKNFIDSLLAENFRLKTKTHDSESELSEWSEDDEVQKSTSESEAEQPSLVKTKSVLTLSTSPLSPPKKPEVFTVIKLERRENERWLKENIHGGWWKVDEITRCEVSSTHPAANFCLDWQRHLTKRSLGFIKPQPVSLVNEYCLLREVFWMFSNAADCKFFKLENEEIGVRSNVSLPSTSSHSLLLFLKGIVRSMNIMHRLRSDVRKSSSNFTLGHTLENYYAVLNVFITEILSFISQQEEIVKQKSEPSYTIIRFQNEFRPHAKMLNMLWDIHESSIADEDKNLPHIRALYLLSSLNHHIYHGEDKEKRNLAITLLLICLKTYLRIFDLWWTEARLHDLKMEFIVERVLCENFEVVQPRLIEKCKERAFYINDAISSRISSDKIIGLMSYFAVEASVSLEIIGKLDRTHEMKHINGETSSLYEEFMERVRREIRHLASNDLDESEPAIASEDGGVSKNQQIVDDIRNSMLAEGDDLMVAVFRSTFDCLTMVEKRTPTPAAIDIYKTLNRATDFIFLPLENRIEKIISALLAKKISLAEKFVMDIYFNEFSLEQRFADVRKVFFLESNELMNYFSLKLFPQMENGEAGWTNPYLMTLALNEAVYSGKHHSTIFTAIVSKKTGHLSVLDAIDEIEIRFNMDGIFENIFTADVKRKYNEVFRFLLKIKWGQRILSHLRFPDFFKRRLPFAKLTMLDLVIKRLALTRFSMQQALNTIHNHIMVSIQGSSQQFTKNIANSVRINEIIQLHETFVEGFYRKSFLNASSKRTRGIILEMLKLSKVISDEWRNIVTFHALDSVGKIDDDALSLAKLNENTIEIENAFKACEGQLKSLLES